MFNIVEKLNEYFITPCLNEKQQKQVRILFTEKLLESKDIATLAPSEDRTDDLENHARPNCAIETTEMVEYRFQLSKFRGPQSIFAICHWFGVHNKYGLLFRCGCWILRWDGSEFKSCVKMQYTHTYREY
jgi:hypothetical protein